MTIMLVYCNMSHHYFRYIGSSILSNMSYKILPVHDLNDLILNYEPYAKPEKRMFLLDSAS